MLSVEIWRHFFNPLSRVQFSETLNFYQMALFKLLICACKSYSMFLTKRKFIFDQGWERH